MTRQDTGAPPSGSGCQPTASAADASSQSGIPSAERLRVIQQAHERGDFVTGEDGFFVYWPTPLHGALNEWVLRAIADELERLNAPWVAKLDEYFASAIEARQGQDAQRLDAEHESAVPDRADAQTPAGNTP